MNIIRWAAVAVTLLIVAMNLGAAIDPAQSGWARIVGAALGTAGLAAGLGLAGGRTWGRTAVIAVGILNMAAAFAALAFGLEGFVPGFVVSGLGIVLGVLVGTSAHDEGALTRPAASSK